MGFWQTIKKAWRESAQQQEKRSAERPSDPLVLRLPTGDSWEVRGESHYQDALRAACAGAPTAGKVRHRCVAKLKREPSNAYDANAVRVLVEGRPVGYIPREDAESLSMLLEVLDVVNVTAQCDAVICGREGMQLLGIWLEMASAMDLAHYLDRLDETGQLPTDDAAADVERRRLGRRRPGERDRPLAGRARCAPGGWCGARRDTSR